MENGDKGKTRIKLCGLRRSCDVEYANELLPDYIGFVFAAGSKRYVSWEEAQLLQRKLHPSIVPIGVFVNETLKQVARLVNKGVIKGVQLHGQEDNAYIARLKALTDCIIIQAFRVGQEEDIVKANASMADYVLLDSGGGTGEAFDWSLLENMNRPYFLAGGLDAENVGAAICSMHPFGVDASSSLEKDGYKDKQRMTEFVRAVRNADIK